MLASQSVAVAVEPERETEMVMLTVRHIAKGELFWPEENGSFYLLTSNGKIVDPLEDDDDDVSRLVINQDDYDLAHMAQQALIEIDFGTQPGGMLRIAEFYIGGNELFGGDIPALVEVMQAYRADLSDYTMLLLYEIEWQEATKIIEKQLVGHVRAAQIPFEAITEQAQYLTVLAPE